jgi:hypothetical protein
MATPRTASANAFGAIVLVMCAPLVSCGNGDDRASTDSGADTSIAAPEAGDVQASTDGQMADVLTDGGPDSADANLDGGDSNAADSTLADEDAYDGATSQLIQAGPNLSISGVTSDDYVIYLDNTTQTFFGAPLDGGSPVPILTLPQGWSSFINIYGKQVALQTWGPVLSYTCQLTMWSSRLSQPILASTAALLEYTYTDWGSPDSSRFIYIRVTNSTQTVGAIYGVNADGTNPTPLIQAAALTPTNTCVPTVSFSSDGYAIISYCPVGPADAGPTHTVASFSLANWSPGASIPNAGSTVAVDPQGEQLVTTSAASGWSLQAFPLDGGEAGVVLDPATPIGPGQSFTGVTSTPFSVIYTSDAGALEQVGVTSQPTPVTLVDGGVGGFLAVAPDGRSVLLSTGSSYSLASTTTPGPLQFVASPDAYDGGLALYLPGGAFTSDSKYVVFFTNVASNNGGAQSGTIHALQIDASAPPIAISNAYATRDTPLGGSRVLVVSGASDGEGGITSTRNFEIAYPGTGRSNVVVAQGAGQGFGITSDGSRLVYSAAGDAGGGIYVAPLP